MRAFSPSRRQPWRVFFIMSTGEFIGVMVALSLALFLSAVAFFKMTTDPVGVGQKDGALLNTPPRGLLLGTVFLSPVCPVERIPSDPACAPKPFVTRIRLQPLSQATSPLEVPTRSDGTFSVKIPVGTYEALATGGNPYPLCLPQRVSISTGTPTALTLFCDTGIR